MSSALTQRIRAWAGLSRLPFHTVGVLPFILGAVLAWSSSGIWRWDVFAWGVAGVVFVMLSTYYAGEYWDYEEDALSAELGPSRFAGGSRVLQSGQLPRHAALWASVVSLLLACAVSLVLQFAYRTGPWTIPFAIAGLLGGFFYSTRPVRWVSTGFGELWIAFCYGWLPVAVGFYLQTSEIVPLVHWVAVPIGLTILNVIVLNEFPDYPADLATGKANLVVRLGQQRAAIVYGLVSAGSWTATLVSVWGGVPTRVVWFYLPVLALSIALVVALTIRGRWRDRAALEWLCGLNLLTNLGTTAALILAFVS